MEEEIDLREYVEVIVRRWKWIGGITLVAVVTAAIISFLVLAPVYEAKAGVVIVKSRSEIAFEPKYRTLTEEDIASRRKALEALVKSSSVAAEVIAKLGSILEAEERDVSALLEMVETESDGDLIGIKVRGKDPKKVAVIANAWGQAYERYVNELYSGRPQPLGSIQAQVAEPRESYQEAQEALARFLGDNQIDALSREIAAKKDTLADYYAAKRQLDRFIADAKALREQLREGTPSSQAAARNSLSLLVLKANASNVSSALPMQPSALPMQPSALPMQPSALPMHPSALPMQPSALPMQLQLSLGQIPSGDEKGDQLTQELKALIVSLEARRAEVQQFIDETPLQQEILQLEEQLEREQARQRELTQARDLAWETYQTLARKEAEVQVATQVTDTEVRFAVSAIEPEYPIAPKKKLNIAIAGMLGLMVGVFGAFFIEFLEGGGKQEEG